MKALKIKRRGSATVNSITHHIKYQWFVNRYRYDWTRCAVEVFGLNLSWQQQMMFESVQRPNSKTSTVSGHGTGKSSSIAIGILIFLITHPGSRVVLTANNIRQVKDSVLKNIKKYWLVLEKKCPWICGYFTLTDEMFFETASKKTWGLGIKACKPGQEEGLAGEHSKHMLFICDEASGFRDKAMEVITGACTEEDNRILLISQPTRDSGFFWRTHNDPALMQTWTRIVMNSEECPFVEEEWLVEQFLMAGCNRDNPQYMIRVRGEFPKAMKGYLVSMDELQRAVYAAVTLDCDWGWVATVDVGNGGDSCVLTISQVSGERHERKAIIYSIEEYSADIGAVELARILINLWRDGCFPNINIAVDANGIGEDTSRLLDEANVPVQRILWGKKPFNIKDRELFFDLRAYCHVMFAKAVRGGLIKLIPNGKGLQQASRLPWFLDDQSRWRITSKRVMKDKLGLKSPDISDTFTMIYLADYVSAGQEQVFIEEEQDRLAALNF